MHDRKLGLVLGAGVARGWTHIGVLQALEELGVKPDIVCGCSSGAIVGASYATGRLQVLSDRVRSMTLREVFTTLDVSFSGGGLVEGRRLMTFFRDTIDDVAIESVASTFGVVAMELYSGRELWLTAGPIIDAVRASVALPGVLVPFQIRNRWLVDGAMVNPLPVSLCRSLGADVIIGVSLNGSLFAPARRGPVVTDIRLPEANGHSAWLRRLAAGNPFRSKASRLKSEAKSARMDLARPSYFDVMTQSVFAAQDFISRVRMAADPVDLLIAPNVSGIGLMEFHRGVEAIEAGRAATLEASKSILALWEGRQLSPSL